MPSSPGARSTCARARGELMMNVGADSVVAGTSVPSQNRTENGRTGSAAASSRRNGAVLVSKSASLGRRTGRVASGILSRGLNAPDALALLGIDAHDVP